MKSLLLAKSNIRKNKGLTICISLLLMISALFMTISCLILFDFDKNSYRVAEDLNTSDVMVYVEDKTIDKNVLDSILDSSVSEYEARNVLSAFSKFDYNGGENTSRVMLSKKDILNKKLSKREIVDEDSSISSNYIYLPYQFHTDSDINVGDIFVLNYPAKSYKLKVKGFINTIYNAAYSMGNYEMIVDDSSFDVILSDNPDCVGSIIDINYKDGVNFNKKTNKLLNDIYAKTGALSYFTNVDETIMGRTFISKIFLASFLITSVIVIVIIMLMIFNNVSNYIKENMKNLGALKAMGYTTSDLRKSIYLQFMMITIIALVLGIILGYVCMPGLSSMLTAQSGIPYTISFNLETILVTFISIFVFVVLIIALSTKKLKKLEPIIALRDGVESHSFRKNHFALDKTKLGLNSSLSFKNMVKNKKQNIISFITMIFLSFLMVVGLVMYQNFSVKPKLSLLTFDLADGVVIVDPSAGKDVEKYLKNSKEVDKYYYQNEYTFQDEEFEGINFHITSDTSMINNQDVCYEGRMPKYDNEVAISGKYASEANLKIGDEIKFLVGDKKYTYLISGFIQSTNNMGHEGSITYEGAKHLFDIDNYQAQFYFDSNVKASKILDELKDIYGDKILGTVDFEGIMKSQLGMFVGVANLMVIVVSIISACIIFLVLYLLIKTLVYDRRYEYGILKAVGYKSSDLIKQNVLSFMPTIILGSVIGTIISYFVTNPYIGMMMRPFGIMKCTMDMPIYLMIVAVLFMVVISIITTILMSLKIKKIEPTKLLVGE